MQVDIIEHISTYQNYSPEQLMNSILEEAYPQLFDLINASIRNISAASSGNIDPELPLLAQRAWEHTDELYRKEKLVLFPYLLTLINEKRKSENCKIFKPIKQLHAGIVSITAQFNAALQNDTFITELEKELLSGQITSFEKQHRIMQLAKDKYLFQPFRSCLECRLKKV